MKKMNTPVAASTMPMVSLRCWPGEQRRAATRSTVQDVPVLPGNKIPPAIIIGKPASCIASPATTLGEKFTTSSPSLSGIVAKWI
jgi:hypothetical protein